MNKILIKNGRCWDGEKFFYADILTSGKYIEKIGNDINEKADYVYDATGKIVSAGLVDLHVHLKGISTDKYGIEAHMCSFPFGVTALNDADGIKGDKTLLNSFSVKSTVFVRTDIEQNHARFSNTEKYLEKFGDKAIGIKVYFDTQISEVKDIKPLCEVAEFAEANNLIVMVHSSNSPVSMAELLGVLRKGDILTHAYHGGTNNVSEDGFKCIKTAKKRGVIIDAGLAGYVHTDFKVFENAISCGAVPDVISTDITRFSAYKRGGRYGMTMCMSIAKHLGMSEEDIFRTVTSAPAKALGMEDKVVVKEWLREFNFRVTMPCGDNRSVAWDMFPHEWIDDPKAYDKDRWLDQDFYRAVDMENRYRNVTDSLDELLASHGYRREGNIYKTDCGHTETIAFFCHFGLEMVLLSRLCGISPIPLWHHFAALPTSVTTLYTEERREGTAVFRCCGFGDIGHLYAGQEEPSFSARFCETFHSKDRHD